MSGQGPYFGQLAWFKFYHHERIPSAVERYAKEASRVTAVIDTHLAKTGSKFLVGDKCTYADFMWLPYYLAAKRIYTEHMDFTLWPHFSAWLDRVLERPAASRVVKEYEDAVAAVTEERKKQAERNA
jgi:glutathione S-transferase